MKAHLGTIVLDYSLSSSIVTTSGSLLCSVSFYKTFETHEFNFILFRYFGMVSLFCVFVCTPECSVSFMFPSGWTRRSYTKLEGFERPKLRPYMYVFSNNSVIAYNRMLNRKNAEESLWTDWIVVFCVCIVVLFCSFGKADSTAPMWKTRNWLGIGFSCWFAMSIALGSCSITRVDGSPHQCPLAHCLTILDSLTYDYHIKYGIPTNNLPWTADPFSLHKIPFIVQKGRHAKLKFAHSKEYSWRYSTTLLKMLIQVLKTPALFL